MVELYDLILPANVDLKPREDIHEDVNVLLLEFQKEIILAKMDNTQDRTSVTYDMRDSSLGPYEWLEDMKDAVRVCEILCKKGYECELYGDEYEGEIYYRYVTITWKKSAYYDYISGHLLIRKYNKETRDYSEIVRDDNLLKNCVEL